MGKTLGPHYIVSDESGIDGRFQSVCFVAGPRESMTRLNQACREALKAEGTSEISFRRLGDNRKQRAARTCLTAFLDCPDCRAMVLSWDIMDARHQVERRDNHANFHRMLFHGLRSVADWFGDVEWYWCHDENRSLDQHEIREFLNNTRGYRALSGVPVDLFGSYRHMIRFSSPEQRSSKDVALIGVADLLAGAVRHSLVDGEGCVQAYRSRGGQLALDLGEVSRTDEVTEAKATKREIVGHIRRECGRRKLGVSLETMARLTTHKKGSKIWIWHYEAQGDYDKAPRKDQR